MSVAVLADTTACIPAALLADLQIELVPYHVIRRGENLRDMVDVEPASFSEYLASLATTDKLPTTSFPSPGEYLEAFERLAARTREIVALTMTSKGSGAFQSCTTAAETMRQRIANINIQIVDTLQVAMAFGWAVIEAARRAREGASPADVVRRAGDVAGKAVMIQTADTLRYLFMGGRIGRAAHLVGSVLDIKPLIGMQDGIITPLGTARTRSKAYARMVELAVERIGSAARVHMAFTYCGGEEIANPLRELYSKSANCVEQWTTPLSPALAVHSGPGTVGMCFFAE